MCAARASRFLSQMRSSGDEALAAAGTIADEMRQREADAAAEAQRAAAEALKAEADKKAAAGSDDSDEAAAEAAGGRHIHLHLHADERVVVDVAEPAQAGKKAAKGAVNGTDRHASESEEEE